MRVLASCDSRYFLAFGRTFYTSAIINGYIPIINVINPTEQVKEFSVGLKNIHFTEETNTRYEFYASHRFIIAPKHVEDGLLIADIDSIFLKPIDENIKLFDLGFAIRKFNSHPEIFAGLVWINRTDSAKNFAVNLSKRLVDVLQKERRWGIDQTILSQTYTKHIDKIKVIEFNKSHIDWSDWPVGSVWAGKGTKKYSDKYMQKVEEIKKDSFELFGEVQEFETLALEASKDTVLWHSPDAWKPRIENPRIKHARNSKRYNTI